MEKVTHIDIVFENCESIRLQPDMFRGLVISGITHAYWINCFQYEDGEMDDFLNCDYFSININEKGLSMEMPSENMPTLKERLTKCRDITHVDVFFSETEHTYISVPWGHENRYTNERQKEKEYGSGLLVTIKRRNDDKNDG